MKILTWNVNGLRSVKHQLNSLFKSFDADVLCLQEIKLSRIQLEESVAVIANYSSYFNFPKYLAGYSGVATYCRDTVQPESVQLGFVCDDDANDGQLTSNDQKDDDDPQTGHLLWRPSLPFTPVEIKELESEGRTIITRHQIKCDNETRIVHIINVYCPRNDPDRPERGSYKMRFHHLLEEKSRKILEERNNHVIIVGDINISHQRIDHCHPCDDESFDSNPARQWLNAFLMPVNDSDEPHFIDLFRHFHPDERNAYTCWNTKLGTRLTNYGTRIDYIIADSGLIDFVSDCCILRDVLGSDHCPVLLQFSDCFRPQMSGKLPKQATKYWPEFGSGKKQLTLHSFVVREKVELIPNKLTVSKRTKTVNSIEQYFQPLNKKCRKLVENDESRQCNSQSSVNGDTNLPEEVDPTEELIATANKSEQLKQISDKWKNVLPGPKKPPNCRHNEACLLRTVTKSGPNKGKQFYVCRHPVGDVNNPQSRCNYFKWLSK